MAPGAPTATGPLSQAVRPPNWPRAKRLLAKKLLAKRLLAKRLLAKKLLAKRLLAKKLLAKKLLAKRLLAKKLPGGKRAQEAASRFLEAYQKPRRPSWKLTRSLGVLPWPSAPSTPPRP